MSEAIMLELGKVVGRQTAHEIIYEIAQSVENNEKTFKELLLSDPRVTTHLDKHLLSKLFNPQTHIGLSSQIAKKAAKKAHRMALQLSKV